MTTNQSPIEPTYKEKVDDILLRAIAKWEAQGRSEDEKWAVRNFETGTMIEAKRQLTTLLLEAENKYPWSKIQRHATYEIPTTNLDADPTGNTVEYQTCYILPKEWVDKEAAELTKGTHE